MKLARSFKQNNRRRCELIRRDVPQCNLSEAEKAELKTLEAWCDAWVEARHSLSDLSWIREKAQAIGIDLP